MSGFELVECEVRRDILRELCTGQLVYSSGAMGKIGVKYAGLGSHCNGAMPEVAEIAQGA